MVSETGSISFDTNDHGYHERRIAFGAAFLAFGNFDEWTWQSAQFVKDNFRLEMLARQQTHVLLRVTPGNLPSSQPSLQPIAPH